MSSEKHEKNIRTSNTSQPLPLCHVFLKPPANSDAPICTSDFHYFGDVIHDCIIYSSFSVDFFYDRQMSVINDKPIDRRTAGQHTQTKIHLTQAAYVIGGCLDLQVSRLCTMGRCRISYL